MPVRELEGLRQQTGLLYGQVPDRVEMTENGVRFWVDVKQSQKTGYFLDQKENRAAIAPFARDARVLDCFTHTGSFALHAAHYGAQEVTGVDISQFACDCAVRLCCYVVHRRYGTTSFAKSAEGCEEAMAEEACGTLWACGFDCRS